jgi:hypothetical protein
MGMQIDLSTVKRVYSGKPGCGCGCRGEYKVPARNAANGITERGYAYSPEDVSDRSVAIIVHKIEKIANGELPGEIEMMGPNWLSANNDYPRDAATRTYIVYFETPQPGFVEAYGHLATKVLANN